MVYDASQDLVERGAAVYSRREVRSGGGGVVVGDVVRTFWSLMFPGYITA
jgi:hypothetical protein